MTRAFAIPESQWADIAKRRKAGEAIQSLASEYGVSLTTINNCIERSNKKSGKPARRKAANGEIREVIRPMLKPAGTPVITPQTLELIRRTLDEMILTLAQLRADLGR